MKRFFLNFLLILAASIFLAGCIVFPYAYNQPETVPTEPVEVGSPTPTTDFTLSTPEADWAFTPTPEPEPLPTQIPLWFTLQPGTPFYLPVFAHPGAGCQWIGVAGQVFLDDGTEAIDLVISAGSDITGEETRFSALTGEALAYGQGGYEIQLGDRPAETSQAFWVQVYSQEGQVLSDQYYFDTFDDCEKNLVLINFIPMDPEAAPKTGVMAEPTPTLPAYP